MRHLAYLFLSLVLAGAVLIPAGGCTDKGDGLMGAGPDDRTDRGGGPDTVAVFAAADTYYEQTLVDNGTHVLVGSESSTGLEAVSFLRFANLPDATGELAEVFLVLYTDTEIVPSDDYNVSISLLKEAAPSKAPFWQEAPDTTGSRTYHLLSVMDTTSSGIKVYSVKIKLPVDWVSGWIEDPSSNFGLRIFGGRLEIGDSGAIRPAFRRTGQYAADLYSLAPRLRTKKTDQTDHTSWTATEDFYVYRPVLAPVGHLASMQLGGVFEHGLLLRFPIMKSPACDGVCFSPECEPICLPPVFSVNKALLTLKVDKSQPDANQGLFNVVARPVKGGWSEDSENVDVELDPATTTSVEVNADDDTEIVLDVTALVSVFADSIFAAGVFEVAVFRSVSSPTLDGLALLTRDGPDTTNAPFLKLVFTTPPGGRFDDEP